MKPKPNVTATSLRIDNVLLDRIKAQAKSEDRTFSSVVHRALTQYLHRNEKAVK